MAELHPADLSIIEKYAERALLLLASRGIFPTPIDEVAATAGICEMLDLDELPEIPEVQKPSFLRKLLGALHIKERVVWVDRSQRDSRIHWTKSHEVGHQILPWHHELAYLDDEERLRFNTHEEHELQANYAAAYLVFQGPRFFEQAADYPPSIDTPMMLAGDFGASAHATIRHFCERHPNEPVVVVITGRRINGHGRVPIYHAAQSPAFHQLYGSVAGHWDKKGLPLREGLEDDVMAKELRVARNMGRGEFDYPLQGYDDQRHVMRAEFFDNGWNHFVMLHPRRVRMGRRIRAA